MSQPFDAKVRAQAAPIPVAEPVMRQAGREGECIAGGYHDASVLASQAPYQASTFRRRDNTPALTSAISRPTGNGSTSVMAALKNMFL